jgi:hypothetical protein
MAAVIQKNLQQGTVGLVRWVELDIGTDLSRTPIGASVPAAEPGRQPGESKGLAATASMQEKCPKRCDDAESLQVRTVLADPHAPISPNRLQLAKLRRTRDDLRGSVGGTGDPPSSPSQPASVLRIRSRDGRLVLDPRQRFAARPLCTPRRSGTHLQRGRRTWFSRAPVIAGRA